MEKAINKHIKILLVEDNLINIKVFTTILTDYGYTNITVAKTGEEALAFALNSNETTQCDITVDQKAIAHGVPDLNNNLTSSINITRPLTEATNGKSNTETLLAPFDIIFLDIGLPGISGLDVCKKIRQQFPDKTLPIVVLTACGDEVEKESLQAGCSAFFTKPVNAEQLISSIERWSHLSSELSQDYFY